MFNILSLSGGGKEQRCWVGWLEESSVANSIVNIIPDHLLPVKAQAKFVLCCAHGCPVAKSRETLSGQREHYRVRSHKTMPTVTPTPEFKHRNSKNVGLGLRVPLYSERQRSSGDDVLMLRSWPISGKSLVSHAAPHRKSVSGSWRGQQMWVTMKIVMQNRLNPEQRAQGSGLVRKLHCWLVILSKA